MFEPLTIVSKPNAKRRDFICGIWVDVKPEDVYVGSIEAKEPKMTNRKNAYYRRSRLVVEASVRNSIALAKTCLRLGYAEQAHKHFAEARFALRVMSQHRAKLERLP